jgi:RNA polymerase sigma factor (sigma-70 family)
MGEAEPNPRDEELVARVQGGDVSAYDVLLIRYQSRLYGVIYNLCGNHEDTNDLLMEVFHKAYTNLAKYQQTAAFYTWIYRIAVNHALNYLKKRKRRGTELSLNDWGPDEEVERELQEAGVLTGEEQLDLADLQKKLNECLQKLSEEQRTVVVLFDIDGMSHADIAKTVGCSEGTVKSRLHNARKNLQRMLEQYLKKQR